MNHEQSKSHLIYRHFLSNPVVKYKPNDAGQHCENNKFYLGDRAGPSRDLGNLLHEICHFAELETNRIIQFPYNWGLSYGKYWQIGTAYGWETRTHQQVDREARVWAFQLACQKEFGMNDSSQDLVSSAIYLPAWCYYQRKYRLPNTIQYNSRDRKALYKLARKVERMSLNMWNFNRLIDDFNLRVQLIKGLTPCRPLKLAPAFSATNN